MHAQIYAGVGPEKRQRNLDQLLHAYVHVCVYLVCAPMQVWDLRKGNATMTLKGHSDTITGMSLSPDGNHLLTNAMDNTLRVWDMRPYAPANRCVRMMTGEPGTPTHPHTGACAYTDSDRVSNMRAHGSAHVQAHRRALGRQHSVRAML